MKMIGNKCLLDTSVIIHYFRKNPPIIEAIHSFSEIYVSPFVIGELYYGAYASGDPEKHISQIEAFLKGCLVLNSSKHSAIIYADLKASLKRKRTPVPENDIWIAAEAKNIGIPVFTTDKHFQLMNVEIVRL